MERMTKEELLIPRVKVSEEGYPDMPFKKGEILVLNHVDNRSHVKPQNYVMYNGNSYFDAFFRNYPSLFKFLAWWEDRKPEQMPEYVVDKEDSKIMYKVHSWSADNSAFQFAEDKFWITKTKYFVPATREEYEQQNKPLCK